MHIYYSLREISENCWLQEQHSVLCFSNCTVISLTQVHTILPSYTTCYLDAFLLRKLSLKSAARSTRTLECQSFVLLKTQPNIQTLILLAMQLRFRLMCLLTNKYSTSEFQKPTKLNCKSGVYSRLPLIAIHYTYSKIGNPIGTSRVAGTFDNYCSIIKNYYTVTTINYVLVVSPFQPPFWQS